MLINCLHIPHLNTCIDKFVSVFSHDSRTFFPHWPCSGTPALCNGHFLWGSLYHGPRVKRQLLAGAESQHAASPWWPESPRSPLVPAPKQRDACTSSGDPAGTGVTAMSQGERRRAYWPWGGTIPLLIAGHATTVTWVSSLELKL